MGIAPLKWIEYYNIIPIYPIFYLPKGDYSPTLCAPEEIFLVISKLAARGCFSKSCKTLSPRFRVYIGFYRGYMGIMEKKMETTTVFWGHIV